MYIFKILMIICSVIFIYKCFKEENTNRAYKFLFISLGFFILSLIEQIVWKIAKFKTTKYMSRKNKTLTTQPRASIFRWF